MRLNSILFPTDFSHYNDAALEYASTLAAESNAKLHIVHVHEANDMGAALGETGFLYEEAWKKEDAISHEQLSKIVPTVASVKFEHHYLTGTPSATIAGFAEDNDIGLIVMASHGRSGISRLMLGSVAEGVMRKAPCPVVIVKQPGSTDERMSDAEHQTTETRFN